MSHITQSGTQGSQYKIYCCRMPPTKRTTRGRPRTTSAGDAGARQSARRRGRSTGSSIPTLLQAAPPAESLVQQYFDDEPALQQVIHEVAHTSGMVDSNPEQRMRLMEQRQEASDKLLHEMHAMVCNMRQGGGPTDAGPMAFPVAAPSAAASRPDQVPGGDREVPAAPTVSQLTGGGVLGQARGSNRLPSATVQAASAGVPSFDTVGAPLGQPQDVAAATWSSAAWCTAPGSATAAPWPSAETISTGNDNLELPRAAQDLVASLASAPPSFSSPTLSRHSRVSEKLKTQIWAGEYVSIASLLHDSSPQSYSVSIRPSEDSETPTFSVAPKERNSPLSFNQWVQGFEVLMSVYLLAPRHRPEVHAMLMYIQTVRNLSQRGADWRSYDEAFRSLRMANNWAWDEVCWPLWMDAAEGRRVASNNASPFQGKGKSSSGVPKFICYNFNRGKECFEATCRYRHCCKVCGGPHSAMRCNKAPHTKQGAGAMPSRPAAAGSRPPWFKR